MSLSPILSRGSMIFLVVLLIFFWVSVAAATENSDLVEEVSVPRVPERRERSAREIQLSSLRNFVLTGEEGQETLALVVYPLASHKSDTAWDDLDAFAQDTDRKFFRKLSKKVIAGGALCAAAGAIVPHPSCGYIIYNVGNFLKIPIASPESRALIAWITITTTPAFAQQSFHIGRRLVSYIFGEDAFNATKKDDDSRPHVFKKNRVHYAAKAALLGSAIISGAVPTILMRNAERDFPVFVAATVFPFYFAWLENYYKVGSLHIDRIFRFYAYTPCTNDQKREILKQKIAGFKKALQQNDTLVKSVYSVIYDQHKSGFAATDGSPFAFSALFLRNLARMTGDEETSEMGQALLMNFKADVDATIPRTLSADLFTWGSTFVTGAGTYTRYCITQNVLNGLLEEFGVPAETAFIASTSLAAFESVYRVATSHHIQQRYFTSFREIFTAGENLTLLRKGAGAASFLNGALFSLPTLVAGLNVFETASVTSKVAWLLPSFLLDLSYYDSFFNRHYQDAMTNLSTLREEKIGTVGQRAHLIRYANKALHDIDEFDVETIEKLYKILQRGV